MVWSLARVVSRIIVEGKAGLRWYLQKLAGMSGYVDAPRVC